MKKILNIVTSVKGQESFSNKLSNAVLEKLSAIYPDSSIQTRNLAAHPFPHLEESHVTSFFTPEEMRTPENHAALQHSDAAISEIMDADIIVICVPVYNFGIPSTLKAWIDHIARAGVTFSYEKGYPEGLVVNKKVYLAIASGAVFSEGPMKGYDFTEPYLRGVLGFLGMTDITAFRIEGTKMAETAETAWPKAVAAVNEFAF